MRKFHYLFRFVMYFFCLYLLVCLFVCLFVLGSNADRVSEHYSKIWTLLKNKRYYVSFTWSGNILLITTKIRGKNLSSWCICVYTESCFFNSNRCFLSKLRLDMWPVWKDCFRIFLGLIKEATQMSVLIDLGLRFEPHSQLETEVS